MTIAPLIDGWRNRPAHERWLIGVPVVALLAAIVYLGVVEPLSQSTARLERMLPDIEVRHARLRAQATDVRTHPVAASAATSAAVSATASAKGSVKGPATASATPAPSGNAAAMASVARAAIDRHRLRSASPAIEQPDGGRIRIAFARVPFHAVWPFFQDLQSQSGIRVVALRIDRIDASVARVEATLASGEARPR